MPAGGRRLPLRPSLLADEANQRLRGGHRLPSHTTLWRFCAGSDLGRASIAAAVNRAMLRRAWAMGARPAPGLLTIDPDATWVPTYGVNKEGSTFSYTHEVSLSPMVGVCGETGDVLALRARGGNANAGRAMGSFVDECVAAIPKECRGDYQLWVSVDSAGYREDVVEAAERHDAAFTITVRNYERVKKAIHALAADPATTWSPALGAEGEKGSEVADAPFRFAGRDLRLIVRRQPTPPRATSSASTTSTAGASTPSSPTHPRVWQLRRLTLRWALPVLAGALGVFLLAGLFEIRQPSLPMKTGPAPWPVPDRLGDRIRAAGLHRYRQGPLLDHPHAHLDILVDGRSMPVPAHLGLGARESPLHTHSRGILHLEAADGRNDFTLGQLSRCGGFA